MPFVLRIQRFLARYVRGGTASKRRTLASSPAYDSAATAGSTFDHALWDALLVEHVKPGGMNADGVQSAAVDYAAISKDARFDDYCAALANAKMDELQPAEALALLINAYNALCIKLIIEEYRKHPEVPHPVESITALKESGKAVWDRPAGVFCGSTVSLGEIEHKRLRGEWDEPKIHFCIVCASASCPDLRNGAFVGSKLREQMDEQAAAFVANETKGLSWDGTTLVLSKIMYWFADDFGGLDSATQHAIDAIGDGPRKEAIREAFRARSASANRRHTTYAPYNWSLNRVP